MATRATSNPWDLTRSHPDAYSEWQYETANGETLQGFEAWLKEGDPEAVS
jgi:hypothetical protein